uniref:Serine/threonine-protein phosphatase n=2 Tax=Parascaris univalens TaxID=6257 RepID=A0A915CFD1_PARUN
FIFIIRVVASVHLFFEMAKVEEFRSRNQPDSDSSDSTSSSSTEESSQMERDNEMASEDIEENPFIDELIVRLMTAKPIRDPMMPIRVKRNDPEPAPIVKVELKFEELIRLCDEAIKSLNEQEALIRLDIEDLPIMVCGDLHGQFRDLRTIFYACGPPQTQTYLFLGDYVDRGVQGIETISLVLCLKIKYPTQVYMLRGNHEDGNTSMSYGFYDECINRFNAYKEGDQLWRKFIDVFNMLPLAALISTTIFCVHGGLSPFFGTFDDIVKIKRPSIVPPYGLMCDLVWSDPDEKHNGWSMNQRGISFTFGEKIVKEFCHKNNIDLVVRAHQLTGEMVKYGHRFFAGGRLLTIFSAPNYLNTRNDGCVLRISKKLKCSFQIFRPAKSKRTMRTHPSVTNRLKYQTSAL